MPGGGLVETQAARTELIAALGAAADPAAEASIGPTGFLQNARARARMVTTELREPSRAGQSPAGITWAR